ncbi:MAG: hypothetical protein DIZ80_02165 [endosymbiont of Galathealinum brachiosum]|uniref:histidine kinase n=1 Tax=endosymbiont of Galathealinum brachiosum TaxID=2200906 RepID=A0A370DK55_9GAMM|nr:MAG: hypothetical protein DIZ80_02165 [endosymbiont of Galathealinum brachiosum]
MLFRDNQQQPIATNIRIILMAGILVSCMLVATIGIITWYALQNVNHQVENLVNETATKSNLIYEMRIAARERNLHLAMSLLVDDPFLIDEEWMKFKEQGTLFLIAREKFKSQNPGKTESLLLQKQRELSKHAVKLQYELNDLRLSGNYIKAIEVLHEEISIQVKVFSVLDEILAIHEKNNKLIINKLFSSQEKTQKAIALLIISIFSIIYLTSTFLIKRLSIQAEEIKNEGIKYKALIEGSMDGILVLDKKSIIDCNNNALRLFGVDSLTELNRIGLDYFSQFSEEKSAIKSDGIFNAINHALVNNKKRYEWVFKKANNDTFPSDIELQGIELNENNYVQMIIRDITERERIKKALQDANENLENKVKERTDELTKTNQKMLGLAHSAGMSEVASGVLHNVGNVLNSVNVSSSIIKNRALNSRARNLNKVIDILHKNKGNIDDFLKNDEAGKLVIPFLEQLSEKITREQEDQIQEINSLTNNVDHIKNIISMQQSYAGNIGVIEKIKTGDIANDAIDINLSSINNSGINLSKYYDTDYEISIDKHKLIQILVNLISNAKHAVMNGGKSDKNIILGIKKHNNNIIFFVEDNGIGIDEKDIEHVFEFGFKKRVEGHGYGLHHSAISAKELGGTLTVDSDGMNKGATFTLTIPIEQK